MKNPAPPIPTKTEKTTAAAPAPSPAPSQSSQKDEYEIVVIGKQADGKAKKGQIAVPKRRYAKYGPRPPLLPDEILFSRKWVTLLVLAGMIMLLAGALIGVGFSAISHRRREVTTKKPVRVVKVGRGTTIASQCRDILKRIKSDKHLCVYEQDSPPTMKSESCKGMCVVQEWYVKVESADNAIVSLHHVQQNQTPIPSNYQIRRGTTCGANFSCSKDDKCSDPITKKINAPVRKTTAENRRMSPWILTCPDGLKPCVRFANATVAGHKFDAKTSEAGWQKMIEKSSCNLTKASKQCDENKGLIPLVPIFRFRRCKFSNGTENRICPGDPVMICECQKCDAEIDPTRIENITETLCPSDAGTKIGDKCKVRCNKSGKLLAMPDGFKCGNGMHCLLGKCYQLTPMNCAEQSMICS